MKHGPATLALALRLLDRQARLRPDASWHPSPEDLTAYREGKLSPSRVRRVQRHLGFCCDCPDLLLDLERFLPDDDGSGAWEELKWLRSSLLCL